MALYVFVDGDSILIVLPS